MNVVSPTRSFSTDDLELIDQLAVAESREDFWAYRQYVNPRMKIGWFQRELAREFQRFYCDYVEGKRPIMLIGSPPQHGKTFTAVDYVSYHAGRRPDDAVVYTSFSERLGVRANLRLQRMFETPKYRKVFPKTRINPRSRDADIDAAGYIRNREMLEYVGFLGSFRNTTVEGSINGEGFQLGLVDDPLKGRAEANSPTVREAVWEWFTDDFLGRFSDDAGLIVIMTRWHVDDPAGRIKEKFGKHRVRDLRYPAIAEKDEKYRKKGEALFPELKSLEFLLERKSVLTQSGWQSVWQQNPIIKGGGMFPIEKFKFVRAIDRKKIKKSVRYWDKAGTEDGGKFTCGVLMHMMVDNTFIIENVRRGQWSALKREEHIKQCATLDNQERKIDTWVEQEPGSGGKESAESTVRNLAGNKVYADRVTGAKEIRAEPYSAQVEGGNIYLLEGPWNQDFIDEHEMFPKGKFKDQVDAASGAFNKVTVKSKYDSSMSWVA